MYVHVLVNIHIKHLQGLTDIMLTLLYEITICVELIVQNVQCFSIRC